MAETRSAGDGQLQPLGSADGQRPVEFHCKGFEKMSPKGKLAPEGRAWLVERGEALRLEYFKSGKGDTAEWTTDWRVARRYANKRVARFACTLRQITFDRIAEHSWS